MIKENFDFGIMPTRMESYKKSLEALEQTNVPLLEQNPSSLGNYIPFGGGASDDMGTYYFIPKIAHWFSTSVPNAVNIFYFCLLFIPFALGVFYCYKKYSFTKKNSILWAFYILSFGAISLTIKGIYISAIFGSLTIVFLYLIQRDFLQKLAKKAALFLVIGIVFIFCQKLRSHSTTGVLFSLAIFLIFEKKTSLLFKTKLIGHFIVGAVITQLFFSSIISTRDKFLTKQNSTYVPPSSKHPLWHSIYTGLGYLTNDYVANFSDEVTTKKVASIDSTATIPHATLYGTKYESILKQEVLQIAKKDPRFLLSNLFSKFGVIQLFLLTFGNIGLFFAFFSKERISWHLAFWTGIGFNCLFGILVIPTLNYLSGGIALVFIYGMFNTLHFFSHTDYKQRLISIYSRVKANL